MKRLVQKCQSWSWETRVLAILAVIALLPAFAALWEERPGPPSEVTSVATHIPRGYVLIPIDVQNFEALDAVFGRFGHVDLYRAEPPGQPLAVNVRLLRAPQNPSRFAVLVPEREAHQILAHSGSYIVIVKAPTAAGTEFVKSQVRPKRKIVYGGG